MDQGDIQPYGNLTRPEPQTILGKTRPAALAIRQQKSENARVSCDEATTPEALLGPLDEVERKHAPDRLWVKGDISLLRRGARVSIVGSRKASDLGLGRAAKLARLLTESEVVVVSGLAEGVDTAAHTAAIKSGGRTVAVLGTPLDTVFPAKNRELQEQIIEQHLAVSQFTPGSATAKQNFPMRNRTMALISDATVIVEAGERSGTVHQGWEALRLGRQLYLLESLANRGFKWVEELIEHGAQVLSDRNQLFFIQSLPEESRCERFEESPY